MGDDGEAVMGMMEDRVPAMAGDDAPASELDSAERARAAGDFSTALALYDATLCIYPDHVDALAGRGAALRALGRPHEALAPLIEALSRDPDHAEARLELPQALREDNRHAEARSLYALLLRAANAPAQAWHGLAMLCLSEGRDAVAEICLRRAVAIAPADLDARLHLADLLARRGHPAQAVEAFYGVLAIAPAHPVAHAGLAQALIGLGRLDEAADQLDRALAMDPESAVAHLARARLNLLSGDLAGAWDDLEWRWSLPGHRRPDPPGQPWDGAADLAGKTVLLWAEAGIPETIRLLRHVPQVAARGATVVLGVPASLAPLAAELPGVAYMAVSGQPVPAGVSIELNASLAELPRLLGVTLPSQPQPAYLTPPEYRRASVRAPATALLKVGVAWAGTRDDHHVPLSRLVPLLALPGLAAYSLQTGLPAREVAEVLHPALIADLSPSIGDLADLAARIAEMDVVVAADGTVAHLAGALGVPVCVLLPTAPDGIWMLGREESPWYGSARLFRQSRSGDWAAPVQAACDHLRTLLAEARCARDARIQAESGPKAACRAFLNAHLQPGDLLVDVGAGDGTVSLDAAAHPAPDIHVLAIEPRSAEAAVLADTLAIAGADGVVDVVAAALDDHQGPAVVAARQRGGRTVYALPDWVPGRVRTTTLDAVLAERPYMGGRRLVLHLGENADTVLAGLTAHPEVVVFDHHGGGAAQRLEADGYALLRFPGTLAAGAAIAFDGEHGTVLALAAWVAPAEAYGDFSAPDSPAAGAHAAITARNLAAEGAAAMLEGDFNQAGEVLARALMTDGDNAEALANLGVLLRRAGRLDAAALCWMRASDAGPASRANLANVLRELGQLSAAEAEFVAALAADPANPALLYGLGRLKRQCGHAREAVALLERAEELRPGTVPPRELATALLKSGDLARGLTELPRRPTPRQAWVDAAVWDGSDLEARSILVRDDDDAIETVILARFIPQIARCGGLVVVECVPELARLMAALPGVEQVVPRGADLPPVDVVTRLADVPRLIGLPSRNAPPRDIPYLRLPDGMAPHGPAGTGKLRVGIAWSGRATDQAVPLSLLLQLAADPRVALVSLQRGPRADELAASGAAPFVDDLGRHCADLADSAAFIAGLDLVVAADTAEAHVAAAMGKPVWLLLPATCDWHVVDNRDDSVWYPTMRVFRQAQDGSWTAAAARMLEAARVVSAAFSQE